MRVKRRASWSRAHSSATAPLSLHIAFGGERSLGIIALYSSAIQRINIAAAVRDANARAEEGSACGQNALATLYFGGSGVAPSGKEMVSLHSKAAQPATSLHWEHVTKTG